MRLIWTREVANPTLPLQLAWAVCQSPIELCQCKSCTTWFWWWWWWGDKIWASGRSRPPRRGDSGQEFLQGGTQREWEKQREWAHELVYFVLLMCDNKWFWVAVGMALQEQIWTMGVSLLEDVGVSSNHLHILPYFPLCKVVYGQRFVYHKYDIMSAHKTKQTFVFNKRYWLSEMHFCV